MIGQKLFTILTCWKWCWAGCCCWACVTEVASASEEDEIEGVEGVTEVACTGGVFGLDSSSSNAKRYVRVSSEQSLRSRKDSSASATLESFSLTEAILAFEIDIQCVNLVMTTAFFHTCSIFNHGAKTQSLNVWDFEFFQCFFFSMLELALSSRVLEKTHTLDSKVNKSPN